jgi:membrane protein involved in colicin uptake
VNPTPAGHEPNRPTEDGTLAPTAPGSPQPLTRTQKTLTGIVVGAVLIIATLGFIGSYSAVTKLAINKGFGQFAHAFPIAVDAGIIAFLALDLLLTWRRIPYPLLRYTAWGLTAATIAFNAVVSWPDPVGTGMHGVIPVLFVIAVEAARHAIGRIAEIVADKHLEGPNTSRWLLNPLGTFILWRRQRLWGIRKWDTVLELERERRIYIGKLRQEHGRRWRRRATAEQLLVLRLARDGMSVTEAIALPAREEEKRRKEQDRIAREKQQAEDERRRKDDEYKREQQRLEDERLQKIEDERLERERKALEVERERREAARQQQIADAEAKARLDAIGREQAEAAAEAERRRQQEQIEYARRLADEQQRAAAAAKAREEAEEKARLEAERKEKAARRAADMLRAANANQTAASPTVAATSASPGVASPSANATPTAASVNAATATSAAAASARPTTGTASTPAANGTPANASTTATSYQAATANDDQGAATSANGVDLDQVVDVYQLLKSQLGKAPSDQKLGEALGVSRSRAQQLRTAAIDAGHTELAKPMRLAS